MDIENLIVELDALGKISVDECTQIAMTRELPVERKLAALLWVTSFDDRLGIAAINIMGDITGDNDGPDGRAARKRQ